MQIDDAADRMNGKALQDRGKQVLSPLMQLRKKADAKKIKVNRCPFGCKVRDLDDQSYCRHLVGFAQAVYEGHDKNAHDITADVQAAGKLQMEPMVKVKGRRKVQVERQKLETGEILEDGKSDFEWGDPVYAKVRPDDILDRVTCSYRVYRDVDRIVREQAEADQLAARQRDLDKREAELKAREAKLAKPKRQKKALTPEQLEKRREVARANIAKARAARAAAKDAAA